MRRDTNGVVSQQRRHLQCAAPQVTHCSFQLSSECPARCRAPARAAALPLPTAGPLPKCSLPLTGIREIIFFMAPACWHLLPHSRVLSIYSGDKYFFDCYLCFAIPRLLSLPALVSMPGVNGQGRWKPSSSTQLLCLKRLHDLCL